MGSPWRGSVQVDRDIRVAWVLLTVGKVIPFYPAIYVVGAETEGEGKCCLEYLGQGGGER